MPKIKNMRLHKHIAILITAVLIISALACEEIEVPYIVDEDEVARYIVESDVAIELFRTEGLIPEDPYTMPGDNNAVYIDFVDSVRRLTEVYILANNYGSDDRDYLQDFGDQYGVTRSAEATVTDRFFVTTARVVGTDSSFHETVRPVVRYGFFLKLGSDNQAFRGWLLLGFSGGGPTYPTRAIVIREDNTEFSADTVSYLQVPFLLLDVTTSQWDTVNTDITTQKAYLWLNGAPQIGRLNDDEDVTFRIDALWNQTVFYTVSAETGGGFVTETMLLHSDTVVNATLTTPSDNSRPWNVVYLQEFMNFSAQPLLPVPIDSLTIKGWCVPYRIED
jgi:hypothetical protein